MASSPESDTGFSTGSSSGSGGDHANQESSRETGASSTDDDIESISSDAAINGRLTALENKSRDHSVMCGNYDDSLNASGSTTTSTDPGRKEEEQKQPDVADSETDSSRDSPTQQLPQYEENEIIFEEQQSPHSTGSGVFGSSVWDVQALPDEFVPTFSSSEEDLGEDAEARRQRAVWYTRFFSRRKSRSHSRPPTTVKKESLVSPTNTFPETPMGGTRDSEDPGRTRKRRRRRTRHRGFSTPWDRRSDSSSSRHPPPLPFHRRLKLASDDRGSTRSSSRSGVLSSLPLLICLSCICLVVFVVAVLATSYVGTRLALSRLNFSASEDDMPLHTVTTAPTMAPTATPFAFCDPELEFLLELRLKFDARPAEIGITLADNVAFGAPLWEFNQASSFRSFSQFLRRNSFAICLSRNSGSFRLTISDRGEDGLRASFGAGGTAVFGDFSVAVDGESQATYNGDCGADPFADSCGPFCQCEYRIENRRVDGDCVTECT